MDCGAPAAHELLLAIDRIHSLFHLLDILGCTGIQRVLHHRLLGAATAPEGSLQSHISSQARIDLDHAMGACQPTYQSIISKHPRVCRWVDP